MIYSGMGVPSLVIMSVLLCFSCMAEVLVELVEGLDGIQVFLWTTLD